MLTMMRSLGRLFFRCQMFFLLTVDELRITFTLLKRALRPLGGVHTGRQLGNKKKTNPSRQADGPVPDTPITPPTASSNQPTPLRRRSFIDWLRKGHENRRIYHRPPQNRAFAR